MKKTIEKTFCDDCGKEISCKEQIITLKISSQIQKNADYVMDFCMSCITWRVNHSISIIENRTCPNCRGIGSEKEWTGIGSDYEYKKCKCCKGKGVIQDYFADLVQCETTLKKCIQKCKGKGNINATTS